MNVKSSRSVVSSLMLLPLFCSGCVSVALEGANIAKDEVVYRRNIDDAQAGDRVAQYEVGDALCCSVHEGSGFYNTKQAVSWLCRSARQGYGPAMFKVGKILSGDVIDGVRAPRRVAQAIAGSSTNLPVAYGWLRAAEANGVAEAKDRADALWSKMSDQEREASGDDLNAEAPARCTWEEAGLD